MMTTYRISCEKCKQIVENLETVMMDSCTTTLLASRRDGKQIKNTILSLNSDVTYVTQKNQKIARSPHVLGRLNTLQTMCTR